MLDLVTILCVAAFLGFITLIECNRNDLKKECLKTHTIEECKKL